MAKKTAKQLDDEIDAYLRGEKYGPRVLAPRPKWDPMLGAWVGGDKRTLYAFEISGVGGRRVLVAPGTGRTGKAGIVKGAPGNPIGPGVGIPRIATLAEAEEHWQRPLHSGWNVAP